MSDPVFVGQPATTLPAGNPPTPYDNLSMPNSQKLCECQNLAPYLVRLGVITNPNMGFAEAAQCYATFLNALGAAAASGAITEWMRENKAV